ncbi:MAG: hypothetical protein IPN76_21610 [Saprospiraceae bacterium]|nr:hypothetical protein [Saprospiraceae bacterium]
MKSGFELRNTIASIVIGMKSNKSSILLDIKNSEGKIQNEWKVSSNIDDLIEGLTDVTKSSLSTYVDNKEELGSFLRNNLLTLLTNKKFIPKEQAAHLLSTSNDKVWEDITNIFAEHLLSDSAYNSIVRDSLSKSEKFSISSTSSSTPPKTTSFAASRKKPPSNPLASKVKACSN